MVLDVGVANIRRSRMITAQPQSIWAVLADFGSLSSWAANADHSCVLNQGADGQMVGTTRRVQMGRNALLERITEFDPVTALAYDVEGLPARMGRIANRWTLRRAGDGTEVTVTSTVDIGSGRVAEAAEWVVGRFMARQSESMLTGLAIRTENTRD